MDALVIYFLIMISIIETSEGQRNETQANNNASPNATQTHTTAIPRNATASALEESHVLKEQYRLFEYLLNKNRYNPQYNDPTTYKMINVSFYLELHQILALDESTQTIRVFAWIQQDWKDMQLFWHPSEYGNITNIAIGYEDVWRPQIFLTNSVEMDKATTESPMLIYLTINPQDELDGKVSMMFGYNCIFKFSCPINMRLFPFDIQTCSMIFEPFLDTNRIRYVLSYDQMNIDYFRPNQEWTLIDRKLIVNDSYYITAPVPFSRITATFHLRRRPMYYVVSLILPMMVIASFAAIGLFIPVDTPECKYDKLSLGMTALLTFSIQLLQVSSQVPKGTSVVPLLSWFFLCMMAQITISTLVAVWLCEPTSCDKLMKALKWLRGTQEKCYHKKRHQFSNSAQSSRKSGSNIFILDKHQRVTPVPIVQTATRIYSRMKESDKAAHKICMIISVLTMGSLMGGIFIMACFAKPENEHVYG